MGKARNVFEFLEDLKALPETKEEEIFEQLCAMIGAEVLAYRKQHNLSRKQLAEMLRMPTKRIARIEMEVANLTLRDIARIASVLNGHPKVSLGILKERSEESE